MIGRFGVVVGLWLVAIGGAHAVVPQTPAPTGAPSTWVPFSADLKVTSPDGNEATGRFFRDAHGCERQEIPTGPQGSLITTIQNFETGKFYRLMREQWTVQPMKLSPGGAMPRRPGGSLTKPSRHEGYEVFEQVTPRRVNNVPAGSSRSLVAPALDYYAVVREMPNGRVQTAYNIKVGPPPPELFLPPANAYVTEQPGFGGSGVYSAVVLRITFPNQEPSELLTTEETLFPLKTPTGTTLSIITSVTDHARNLVDVRVFRNASGRGANVRGELLDQTVVALGETGHLRIPEVFDVSVRRIAGRVADK
jgi:hypothetical protein